MAASTGGRTLEETPTWAVAVVCIVLVLISIIIEHIIHLVGKWLNRKRKRALYKAFEKIKSELMLLGFISLLLTVGQGLITNICISEKVGSTWHPCSNKEFQHQKLHRNYGYAPSDSVGDRRRLLNVYGSDEGTFRRVLAAAAGDKCAAKGKVPFVSAEGIHQLHIFIFVLAVFHVVNCILTMALGRAKMRRWKAWERETRTAEYELHGLLLQALREVGICCQSGLSHVETRIHNGTSGTTESHRLRFPQVHQEIPGGRLQSGGRNQSACLVLRRDIPALQHSRMVLPYVAAICPFHGDKRNIVISPANYKFISQINHIVPYSNFLQNAFQFAFFAWTSYEFGLKSCFHDHTVEIVIRILTGILVQILCSYITLPLYALVTQMGSTMKPTIFNERVVMALRRWHKNARKNVRESRRRVCVTPPSSQPTTPSHHTQLTWWHRHRRSTSVDSLQSSPRKSNCDVEAVVEPHSPMDQELALADTFMVTIDEYESLDHTQKDTIGNEALACTDHGDIYGGEGNGECPKEPVAEPSACMQHVIDMEPLEYANGQLAKGVMREIESVDGSYP
ncbi:hypothetical protein SAY87_025423 [Trapa incisa]|uniref:MLO-like protein n=1 Tax=Trapa incisa TaxID=236973 RepID=A0AAN7JGI5_9MYRT|nr:hypothetical protein SAY87_025423 [Trapa incisa]